MRLLGGLQLHHGRLQLFKLLLVNRLLMLQHIDFFGFFQSLKPDLLSQLLLCGDSAPYLTSERCMHVAPTECFLQLKPSLLTPDQEFESLFDPLDASPHPLNDNHLCTALADPVHNLLAESLPTEGTLELHHYLHVLLCILHDALTPSLALNVGEQVSLDRITSFVPILRYFLGKNNPHAALQFRCQRFLKLLQGTLKCVSSAVFHEELRLAAAPA